LQVASKTLQLSLLPGEFIVDSTFSATTGPTFCSSGCLWDIEYTRQVRWGLAVSGDCAYCGLPNVGPRGQSGFGWGATASSIEDDGEWHQVAAFAFFNTPIQVPSCDVSG